MPYSASHKAIFVWIPKTAGTSLGVALQTHGVFRRGDPANLWGRIPEEERREWGSTQWHHLSAEGIKRCLPEGMPWEDYYSFSFVRNPWDRMVSFYEFIRDATKSDPNSIHYGQPPLGTFEEWFEARAPRNQLWYLRDQKGELAVDFVGRFETLDEDFAQICDALGVPQVSLPKIRASNRGQYRDYYSDAMRRKVADKYAEEIEEFKYVF